MVEYIDPTKIEGATIAQPKYDYRNQDGYGDKIATCYMLQYGNKRWRRVYAICHSNAASFYITNGKGKLFLDSITESRLEDLK